MLSSLTIKPFFQLASKKVPQVGNDALGSTTLACSQKLGYSLKKSLAYLISARLGRNILDGKRAIFVVEYVDIHSLALSIRKCYLQNHKIFSDQLCSF